MRSPLSSLSRFFAYCAIAVAGVASGGGASAADVQISEPVFVSLAGEPASDGAAAPKPPADDDILLSCDTNTGGMRDGNSYSDGSANGAVGPVNFVVTSSGAIGVYKRGDCRGLRFMSLNRFFKAFDVAPEPNTLLANARVLYDPTVQRFFVGTGVVRTDASGIYLFYAVSADHKGLDWNVYRVTLQDDATLFCKKRRDTTTASQRVAGRSAGPDGRWFLSAFEAKPPEPFSNSIVLSIGKSETLDGRAAKVACLSAPDSDINVNLVPPVILDDSQEAYFLAASTKVGFVSSVNRFVVEISPRGPARDKLVRKPNINVPILDESPLAQQPNGLKFVMAQPEFRNPTIQIGESLWNIRQTNTGRFARWRLYRYTKTGAEPMWSYSPSSVEAKNDHTFAASLTVDSDRRNARVFVNFGRMIPSGGDDPEARAVTMMAAGNAGVPASWQFKVVSVSDFQYRPFGQSKTCTTQIDPPVPCGWTRQSAIQIDPNDGNVVWGFNQLAEGLQQIDWVIGAGAVAWPP